MKKLILLLSIFIFLISALPAESANLYWRNCLTGGGDCLDGIDGASLADGDGAFVIRDNSGTYEGYIYRLEDTAETESSPDVISPDANAGNKRWRLVNFHAIGFTGPLTGNVTGNVTGDVTGGATKGTLADASYVTWPPAAATVANQLMIFNSDIGSWLTPTNHCFVSGNLDSTEMECKTPANAYAALQASIFDADADGDQDTMTDEHLVCVNVSGATYGLKDCGAKVTDNSTASHAVYKDSSGYMADQVLTIDAHAASTTITLIPGICPIIHNASQADANINNTLPAVGAGKCFVALATSAEADKYWRLTAAAANTICLNRTCGKDYIQFATPAVGDTFTCMSDGTNWYCYDRDSDAEAGDL